MNIQRFAGDNPIMERMSQQVEANNNLMRRRQAEAIQNAYEQRARDVRATGVSDASSYL